MFILFTFSYSFYEQYQAEYKTAVKSTHCHSTLQMYRSVAVVIMHRIQIRPQSHLSTIIQLSQVDLLTPI